MMTCKKCNSDRNPDDANFCGQCGVAFDVDARIATAVKESLEELKAERIDTTRWGVHSARIEDVNSKRVFAKLRRNCGLHAIPCLVPLLKHPEYLTRWKAMRLLNYYGYVDVDVFRDFWEKERHDLVRPLVLEFIERAKTAATCKLLIDISAKDSHRGIRNAGVRLLSKFAACGFRTQAIVGLLDAAYDNDQSIVKYAIEELARLKANEVVDVACELVADGAILSDTFVAVAQVIAEMGDAERLAAVFRRVPESVPGNFFGAFLSKVLPVCVRRFGSDRVLAETSQIPDEEARKKVDEAVRSAPAP